MRLRDSRPPIGTEFDASSWSHNMIPNSCLRTSSASGAANDNAEEEEEDEDEDEDDEDDEEAEEEDMAPRHTFEDV